MRLENGEVLLLWPLALHVLTAGYYYNSGGLHQAIDLRTNQDGSIVKPVYAAESGTVDQVQAWDGHTRTGMQSYGNMVRIRHADYNGKTLQDPVCPSVLLLRGRRENGSRRGSSSVIPGRPATFMAHTAF